MTQTHPSSENAPPPSRRWLWIAAFIVGALSLTILKVFDRPRLPDLPVLYDVPAFTLTDQHDRPFTADALKGKVWVASFAFTSCQTECPAIGQAIQRLQKRLASLPVHFVTISVDPEFDTPERLKAWGDQYHADHTRWHLLTGERSAIEALVIGDNETGGFRTHMGDREQEGNLIQIAHSLKIVLVDDALKIRHYFDAMDEEEVDLLADHAKKLLKDRSQ